MSENSYIEWPESLIPLPKIEHQASPRHSTIQTTLDGGAVIKRARFSKLYHDLSVSWILTSDQWTEFKDFVATDLSNGAAQFKIDLRYPYHTLLTTWSVRLYPDYQALSVGRMWQVQATLELIREFPGPAGALEVLVEGGGSYETFVVEGSVPFILLSL